jgi:hypothetical protein
MPHPDTADARYTPRYPTILAIAALSAWIVILCFPMFAGYFLGGPASDQTWTGIPFRSFWASQFHLTGHIPLWNPYMFGGLPFVGAMHGDIFYPTSFLRIALSADQVLNIVFLLHLILAGVLTYGFLRTIGVSWIASVTGGLAYQMSGIVASLVQPGHDGKLAVSALLPLLLTGLVLGIRRRRPEGFGLVALVVGLDILSPQIQMAQYSLIFAGLFTLWLCFADPERPESPASRWRSLGLAALAVAVGFGVSMIQILPFINYGPFSARGGGAQGWEYATSYAMPPENIVDWLVATFTGVLGKYWGSNFFKLHSEYVGAATLALVAVGVVSRERRRLVWFLAGAFVLFLLVCLGGHTPFYRLWYAIVPGVRVTRAPGMAFFIPTFIFACLAAFGVERLERGEGRKVLVGVLAGAGLLLLLGVSGGLGSMAEHLAGVQLPQAARNTGDIVLGAVLSAVAAAAIAAIGLAAAKGKLQSLPLAALLVVVVGGELFINARRFFTWSPPASRLYAADDMTRRLEATPLPYRVMDLPDGNGVYPTAFLMQKRIPNALGHHGNELNAYDQLLGGKGRWTYIAGSTRLWNLLALRYVLLPVPVHLPSYHVVAHVIMPPGGASTEGTLFEADTAPPYARLVPAAVKVEEDRIVPTLVDSRFDYNRLVLLPPDAPVTTPPLDSTYPPPLAGRATVSDWAPGAMTVRLDPAPEKDAYLLVSENWYPDWHATVDGRDATVLRGQHTLLTVPVPRGARVVKLWFASASYRTGKGMTLASLGAIALWLFLPLALRRRRG